MENKKYYSKINYELFSQNCIDGIDTLNKSNLKDTVSSLISNFGWETLVSEWTIFLKNDIRDRKSAFNFATWLFIYDFGKCSIQNPYPFLALLYKKMELDKEIKDELDERFDTPFDRFFDLYIDVLVSSNILDASETNYIKIDEDQRLIDEINKL